MYNYVYRMRGPGTGRHGGGIASMKSLVAALALTLIVAPGSAVQGPPMPPPPAELKLLWWMKGNWDADLNMFEGGKQIGTAKGPVSCADSLGKMYLESKFETDMGGMSMKGLQLTSYDSKKKEFMAFWFDSMAPGLLEMRGQLKGQTLIMSSKPTSFPGMPGRMSFRSTNSMKSKTQMHFRLEMNTGKGWEKILDGTMTRR
jgi:hypothetical protein